MDGCRPMTTVKTQKGREYGNEVDHLMTATEKWATDQISRLRELIMYVGSYHNTKYQARVNFVGICWRISEECEADPRVILLVEDALWWYCQT